jgi:hypothetical protein
MTYIMALVHQGDIRDAVRYAVGANSNHGKRRTNADKRKAVLTLLEDEQWTNWSDREISRRCSVSDFMVRDARSTLRENRSDTPLPTIGSERRNLRASSPDIKQGARLALGSVYSPTSVVSGRGKGILQTD